MKRRTMIVGGLAGASTLVGTRALSSLPAERAADVAVVSEDDRAYLTMEAIGAYAANRGSDGVVQFDVHDRLPTGGGTGVNVASEYHFDEQIRLGYNGERTVYVQVRDVASRLGDADLEDLYLYVADERDVALRNDAVLELTPGSDATLGLAVVSRDRIGEEKLTVTVGANDETRTGTTVLDPDGDRIRS